MITISQLTEATPTSVEELEVLGRALHEDERTFSAEQLDEILHNNTAIMMVAKDGEKIIGMATLYVIPKVGSRNGLLEDVVVDAAYRGQGLGEKLVSSVIETGRERKLKSIFLTSRAVRVAAHKLYEKLGFEIKETDVFKLSL